MFADNFPQIAYTTADKIQLFDALSTEKGLFQNTRNGVDVVITQIEQGQSLKLNELLFGIRGFVLLLGLFGLYRTIKKCKFLKCTQKVVILIVSD